MNHRLLRAFYALLLVTIFFLSTFPKPQVSAYASTDGSAQAGEWLAASGESEGFVLYASEDNELTCRESHSEDERFLTRGDLSDDLHVISPPRPLGVNGLTITLRATQQLESFPEAKNAFIRAAQTWEALIANQISVIIDVDFGPSRFGTPYPSGVLGSTSSQALLNQDGYAITRSKLIAGASSDQERALYNALPVGSLPTDQGTTVRVTSPATLLRALGVISADANPSTETSFGPPPSIGFNSNFAFDFDPSNGIDTGKMDFDAVAVHEIGHALGFTSRAANSAASAPDASVWDFFRFQPGVNMGTFTNANRVLTRGGVPVFYAGGSEFRVSTAEDGNQTSHWKDDQQTSQHIGIMDPTLPSSRRFVITPNDLTALDAMGYTLKAGSGGGGGGGGGGGTVGNNPPSTSQFNATLDGDTLTVTGVASDVDGDIQQARASLLDKSGNVLSQGTPIELGFGASTQSNFTIHYTSMKNFPSAMKVSLVFTDSRGNQSAAVTDDFSVADAGGATVNKTIWDGEALVLKGSGFVGGLQVEINGVLVNPPKLKVKPSGAKVVVSGSKSVLNLSNGVNRVRVKFNGKFSNISLVSL